MSYEPTNEARAEEKRSFYYAKQVGGNEMQFRN